MLSPLLRVCIVGAGPSGLYTAKYLLKQLSLVRVDVLESMPTPYGLVRFGVAPDHPEVKSVQNDFNTVMLDERVSFFGNTTVGRDVQLDELRKRYDAVVLAYGASLDRSLGIKGESGTKNVFGARDFVNWYNGHPAFVELEPDLSNETAVVIGQGNVAIDCARILTRKPSDLASTDISKNAYAALSKSKIQHVQVIGRRGHLQAAFTIKELRELTKLEDVGCLIDKQELDQGMTEASLLELQSSRPKQRINELLYNIAANNSEMRNARKLIELRFLLSPKEIVPNTSGGVELLRMERTKLTGEAFMQFAQGAGEFLDLPCSLLVRSIGYKSIALQGIPFDHQRNIVKSFKGRVLEDETVQSKGRLYVTGWLKRGPTGIIGTNITDAKETVDSILADVQNGLIPSSLSGVDSLSDFLTAKGCTFITWSGYKKIEAEEMRRGQECNPPKPRDKIISISEMINLAQA